MLVCARPLAKAAIGDDWELFASPESQDPNAWAETWIYRARDPLPLAFCVPEVLDLESFVARFQSDPASFDPTSVASLAEDWRPQRPFSQSQVSRPRFKNNEVFLRARLDGDGLLVLTEQAFPGWKVYVDGEEREVLNADILFRAVALEEGEHEIVFRYEPTSIRVGLWISGISALCIALIFGASLLFKR